MKIRTTSETEAQHFNGGEYGGVEMRKVISDDDGAPNFSMRVFKLAPNGFTPRHAHPHEHEVYILSGTGTVHSTTGGHQLKAGDSVYVEPNDEHQFRAGKDGLQFICCVPHH